MSQIAILLVTVFDLSYLTGSAWISFRPAAPLEAREEASQFYLFVALIAWAGTVRSQAFTKAKKTLDIDTAIGGNGIRVLKVVLWASLLLTVVHFLIIDHDKLWSAAGYQVMKSPEQMGFTSALLPLFLLPRLTGFVGIIGVVVFLRRRDLVALLISALTFGYGFVLALAQNSRLAALYLLAALAANALIGKRLLSIMNAALLSMSLITGVAVLKGRHDPTQGIGHAISQLVTLDNIYVPDFLGLLINVNAGGLITADAIITNANYAETYKALSFSPLPSALDGFSSIREQQERRINYFTPINAFGEVYLFGYAYAGLFLATVFLWVRSATLASVQLSSRFSALIVLLALLTTVTLQQYSLRTGYRFMLLSILLCYAAMWMSKRPHQRGARVQYRRPLPHQPLSPV